MTLFEVFSNVLNMSLTASLVILAVLLTRLPLKKCPKVYSYEDASGQEHQQESRFQTTVNRPIVVLQTELPEEEQEKEAAVQWWAVVLILGGVGLACIIAAFLARRRAKVSL